MKVALATLGCRLNQSDTASLVERLRVLDPEFVEFANVADVYIINTCTVTDKADAEARQLIRRAKRANPRSRVIVTGCYAQVNPGEVAKIEGVDLVVGVGQISAIPAYVSGASGPERVLWSDLRKEREVRLFGGRRLRGRTRSFLKVQEGCNFSCTFCIIPTARGRSRSVSSERVLSEIRGMTDDGVREVVLTGIHLGSYGQDLDPKGGLVDLLEKIERECSPIRLRLSSLDPREITSSLIGLMAQSKIVCPSLHICAQAGEDGVLRRMRRNYDTAMYWDLIHRVREKLPDASLGTDIIVGFPGEGEKEFENSLRFFSSLPLSYFHVFPYSARRGTPAATYADQISQMEKKERSRRMRELGFEKSKQFAKRFLGQTQEVLIESDERLVAGLLRGYARNYLPVKVDHLQAWEPQQYANQLVGVEITATDGRWAVGRLMEGGKDSGVSRSSPTDQGELSFQPCNDGT
jgi:threonylcarbamoyladenosine tRNA methylthiotransferase MtaB